MELGPEVSKQDTHDFVLYSVC
uniref:Uncharacterized protein n=1 Tax=Rhizophora mucronata TaxID=61149 RepID=A0A2P2KU96_RHIMU